MLIKPKTLTQRMNINSFDDLFSSTTNARTYSPAAYLASLSVSCC